MLADQIDAAGSTVEQGRRSREGAPGVEQGRGRLGGHGPDRRSALRVRESREAIATGWLPASARAARRAKNKGRKGGKCLPPLPLPMLASVRTAPPRLEADSPFTFCPARWNP